MNRLTKENLNASTIGDVVFCSVAEGGAMGSPGTVIFANRHNQWFETCFCFGDVSEGDIVDAFPVLDQCFFGAFGKSSRTPEHWNYLYMGFGNHLIVHDLVYDAFMQELGTDKTPPEIYGAWEECAKTALKNIENRKVIPQKVAIESKLMVYGALPKPGDDISQNLTITREGDIQFSSMTIEDLERWNEIPLKNVETRIDPQQAMEILAEIYDSLVYCSNRFYITDVGSWDAAITMEDGSVVKETGSMHSDEKLTKLTQEIRSLLPDLNIIGFGYSEEDDDFSDITEGTEVYNTTFGYGKIKYFIGDTVRVAFDGGLKAFKFPDSFEKKTLVRAEDASSCSEPLSPISSIQVENYCSFREINAEQVTVWVKKKKGRINRFKGDFVLCGTEEFIAPAELKQYLFELVTRIDREEPWRPEYEPCIDDTGVKFTFTYTTGHSKHVNGHRSTIPYMEQIESIFQLMMTPDLGKDDDISYVHGSDKPVFTYWLENDADHWDDPTSPRYSWPLREDTPLRFVCEYKRYVLNLLDRKPARNTIKRIRVGEEVDPTKGRCYQQQVCRNCGAPADEGKYCMQCGASLKNTRPQLINYENIAIVYGPPPEFAHVVCKKCGAEWSVNRPSGSNEIKKVYCPECGAYTEVTEFRSL